jgi:hypothetical protein
MRLDCCVGIFHGTTIHCLLVVMATVEVTTYFRLFLFIAMLNSEGSINNLTRMKFPNSWCIIIFCDMLREIDGCLKCTFSPFNYIEKTKRVTKYKQILPTMFTLLYKQLKKVPHSTFETHLLSHY